MLSTPLTSLRGTLFLSERAHAQTLELLAERFDEVIVIARCRTIAVLADVEHLALADTGAQFGMELPDYGGEGAARGALAFLLSRRLRRAIGQIVEDASLMYIESPSLESILAWTLAWPRRIPYVIEMRGDTVFNAWYMRARLGRVGPLFSALIRGFFGVFRRGATGAIFVGEELRARYAPPQAVTVAVSSVRLPPACPRPARTPITAARRFLFVGHLEKVKALDVMLDAFAHADTKLPDGWRLDLLGDGPERATLEERARTLGIAERVHFHRRVPWGEELFRFYETADFLLISSLTEGNSRTLLEGMAFALPAVSTAVGEAPRLLTPDALVPPADAEAYGAALVRLANSPERLRQLSAHNVAQISQYVPHELRRRRAAFFDDVIQRIRATVRSTPSVPSNAA